MLVICSNSITPRVGDRTAELQGQSGNAGIEKQERMSPVARGDSARSSVMVGQEKVDWPTSDLLTRAQVTSDGAESQMDSLLTSQPDTGVSLWSGRDHLHCQCHTCCSHVDTSKCSATARTAYRESSTALLGPSTTHLINSTTYIPPITAHLSAPVRTRLLPPFTTRLSSPTRLLGSTSRETTATTIVSLEPLRPESEKGFQTKPSVSDWSGFPGGCVLIIPGKMVSQKMTRKQLIRLVAMMGLGFVLVSLIVVWVFSPLLT